VRDVRAKIEARKAMEKEHGAEGDKIFRLLAERVELRRKKQYKEADEKRDELKRLGIEVNDSSGTWTSMDGTKHGFVPDDDPGGKGGKGGKSDDANLPPPRGALSVKGKGGGSGGGGDLFPAPGSRSGGSRGGGNSMDPGGRGGGGGRGRGNLSGGGRGSDIGDDRGGRGGGGKGGKKGRNRGRGQKKDRSAVSRYAGQEADLNGMWFCDAPGGPGIPGEKFAMEIACYPGMDPLAVSGRVATANDGQFPVKGEYDVGTGNIKIQLLYSEEPGRQNKGEIDLQIVSEKPVLRLEGSLWNQDGSGCDDVCIQVRIPPGQEPPGAEGQDEYEPGPA